MCIQQWTFSFAGVMISTNVCQCAVSCHVIDFFHHKHLFSLEQGDRWTRSVLTAVLAPANEPVWQTHQYHSVEGSPKHTCTHTHPYIFLLDHKWKCVQKQYISHMKRNILLNHCINIPSLMELLNILLGRRGGGVNQNVYYSTCYMHH